jgi:hypothetical protein
VRPDDGGASGMSTKLEVQVLHGAALEATMSRRQLHEAERGVGGRRRRRSPASIREATVRRTREDAREAAPAAVAGPPSHTQVRAARACGMEAGDGPQRRAQAKLRKAIEVRVSVPRNATPDIQSGPRGSGDGDGGTLRGLTQRDLHGSATSGRRGGGNDDPPMPVEKSDHLVVATKPGNSGGAKGVTG